jgi:hypothetical protein
MLPEARSELPEILGDLLLINGIWLPVGLLFNDFLWANYTPERKVWLIATKVS